MSDRIAEIKERVQGAPPGPWEYDRAAEWWDGEEYAIHWVKIPGIPRAASPFRFTSSVPPTGGESCLYESAAAFIAHARADVPWLLDRLAALEAENATLRGALERIGTPWTPELREQLIRTFDMRYEELSEDLYDDGDGTMSIHEKEARSIAAVLGVFRWWILSGEVTHYLDALAAIDASRAALATPRRDA